MLLTTSQAAQELGCAVTTFRRLTRTGAVPNVTQRGARTLVPWKVVRALRELPMAPLERLPAQEIGVLRVGAARRVQEMERSWSGFHVDLQPTELLESLRGWWRCDARSVAAGEVLPVTVAGYVVAVLTNLTEWDRAPRGLHRFTHARIAGYVTNLAESSVRLPSQHLSDRDVATALLATRLPSHSSAAIAYVPTRLTH
jgi:hypothetical protein